MPPASDTTRITRQAGLIYLGAAILAMFGYLYLRPRFVIPGDAAATARNILAHEQLYRTGILIDVAGQILFLVAVLLLYRLFQDVDRNQARLMVALIGTAIAAQFAGFALNVAPLVLLGSSEYLSAFTQPQRDALAYAAIGLNGRLGELLTSIWGLWLFPFALLTMRSGFLPKFLGILLIASGVAYVLSFVTAVVFPAQLEAFSRLAFPFYLCELIVVIWLAVVGARPRTATA